MAVVISKAWKLSDNLWAHATMFETLKFYDRDPIKYSNDANEVAVRELDKAERRNLFVGLKALWRD